MTFWHPLASYERISLKNVKLSLRIGAFASERQGFQPVEVDVDLYRRSEGYKSGGLSSCLDYDRVYRYLTKVWPARAHLELLEAWAEDLVTFCLEDQRIETCVVRIRKLEIYPGTAVPEVEIVRHRHLDDS